MFFYNSSYREEMNILIFGIGKNYQNNRNLFKYATQNHVCKILGFVDNDEDKAGLLFEGKRIYLPSEVHMLDYDAIVVSTKKYYKEIAKQLIELGINENQIFSITSMKQSILLGLRKRYIFEQERQSKKRILIITTDMGNSGGIRVILYAALALKEIGYYIEIAAPDINPLVLDELQTYKINFNLCFAFPYMNSSDEQWISEFDAILVNVFQMINCAYFASKVKPVLWWVHEPYSKWCDYYTSVRREFAHLNENVEWLRRVKVYGVSRIAQNAFNHFYPGTITENLPFGIPLVEYVNDPKANEENMIFAVLAGYAELKGQDILVDAVSCLDVCDRNRVELWFIGPSANNADDLLRECKNKKVDNVRCFGFLQHNELIEQIKGADVIVCPSLVETMSMAIVEGMMLGKVCITTDATGIADYIIDGINGYITRAGDSRGLAEKIKIILHNREKNHMIGYNAKDTFKREFELHVFGKRIEKKLIDCMECY